MVCVGGHVWAVFPPESDNSAAHLLHCDTFHDLLLHASTEQHTAINIWSLSLLVYNNLCSVVCITAFNSCISGLQGHQCMIGAMRVWQIKAQQWKPTQRKHKGTGNNGFSATYVFLNWLKMHHIIDILLKVLCLGFKMNQTPKNPEFLYVFSRGISSSCTTWQWLEERFFLFFMLVQSDGTLDQTRFW